MEKAKKKKKKKKKTIREGEGEGKEKQKEEEEEDDEQGGRQDSGACLFWLCTFVAHSASCCVQPTASPLGHRCVVGVLGGTHRCA